MSDNTIGSRPPSPYEIAAALPATAGGQAAGTAGTSDVGAAQAAALAQLQGAGTGPLASLQGNKYAGAAGPNRLPPPTLPRLATTNSSLAESQSFLQEAQGAAQASQAYNATLPANQRSVPAFLPGEQTRAQAVNQLVKWGQNQAQAVPAFTKGSLYSFLLTRLTNDQLGVQSLQKIAEGTSASQATALAQEQARSREAEAAAKKAAAKAASLGIFGKIFEVVIAVVTVVLTVCSFGGLTAGCAAVLAAGAAAFAAAGAIQGAKKHEGFDFFAGLNVASTVVGLGGAGALFKSVGQAVLSGVSKLTDSVLQRGVAEGVKAGGGAAARNGAGVGGDVVKLGSTAVPGQAGELAQQQKLILENLTKKSVDQIEKEGVKSAARAQATGDAAGSGAATGEVTAADILANLAKATGHSKADFGKLLIRAQVGVAAGSAVHQIGSGAIQLRATELDADSKESLAVVALLKAFVDRANGSYKTTQDTIDTLSRSHNDAVDTINQSIQDTAEVSQRIAKNFS